ncbi:MAG: DUF1828 domain-containing protein [Clostridia bacterium]|nr:DUF1828 domain-containing protein [Clostridia bacterium]
MIDVKRIIEKYKNSVKITDGQDKDAVFISFPFFFPNSDDSIAIRVTNADNGLPILSDCHVTCDYLEINGIDIEDYRDRLEVIMKRYGLILDGNVFRMTVPSDDDLYVEIYLGYFVQALTLIANISLLTE